MLGVRVFQISASVPRHMQFRGLTFKGLHAQIAFLEIFVLALYSNNIQFYNEIGD